MFVAPLGSTVASSPAAEAVNLTGATIASVGNGYTVAIFYILADGTLWKYTRQGGTEQIDAGTDWIIPNEDADSTYDVRYTNHVGDPLVLYTDIAVEGTWVSMGIGWSLHIFTADDEAPVTCTFDLQFRKDEGDVLATASFTMSATRTS